MTEFRSPSEDLPDSLPIAEAQRSPAQSIQPPPPIASTGVASQMNSETRELFQLAVSEISKIFVGQDELILTSMVALFSGGHVLIEGVPGLGKTLFVRTLGHVLGCQFGRIQFTADLMPSDITGAPIWTSRPRTSVFVRGLSLPNFYSRTRSIVRRPKHTPHCWRSCRSIA